MNWPEIIGGVALGAVAVFGVMRLRGKAPPDAAKMREQIRAAREKTGKP